MSTHDNNSLTNRLVEKTQDLTPLERQLVDYLMNNPKESIFLSARELAEIDCPESGDLDIHIHVPESVIYKDGPSAGLAFTAGIYGALIGDHPGASSAFTGEVSLSGRVDRVGGISEKMGAAYFAGLTDVYLPAANLPDLASVPPQVKQHLNLHLISDIRQAKEMIWSR